MLSLILAAVVIFLGAKGFTKNGIPLTATRNLQGVTGQICGGLCFALAAFLIFDGLIGTATLLKMFSR